MAHELSSKSPDQRDKTNTPISTLPIDTCAERVEMHSTRVRTLQLNTDAQDRNSKTKRLFQGSRGKIHTAKRTKMEGEHSTITVRLRNKELWEMFHLEETEMIITKAGRYVLLQFFFRFKGKKWISCLFVCVHGNLWEGSEKSLSARTMHLDFHIGSCKPTFSNMVTH